MKIFRVKVRKTKEIRKDSMPLNRTIRKIVEDLEKSKANNIHINGNIVTFKNNVWEWRIDGDLMGVLKEGKFELVENENSIIVHLESYYSILNDFLLFPPIAFVITFFLNDARGLFFLLGTVFGIIIKKDIVSRKLASFFEKL